LALGDPTPLLARKLELVALPQWWTNLFAEVMAEAWVRTFIFGIQICSGREALSEAFRTHVGPLLRVDTVSDPENDALTMQGLRRIASWMLRIGRNGYVHLGTPCKSWAALSRSWSKRSMLAPQ
ncbi:MAG: hypothetical protein ACKPKO_45890, partial [Candidatus Fonsibacter sp.]